MCTVVLGFLDILLNLLSADVSANANEQYMDVITYVVSAMCVLNDEVAGNSKEDKQFQRIFCVANKTIRSPVLKHPLF